MDNTAIFKLTYGVFVLATKFGEEKNACITNTCMQIANSPARIAIACINANYTCELLKKSGKFTLSILDESCTFDTIRHFGMQSGREADKITGMQMPEEENGIPYMGKQSCAVLCATVTDSVDLGSHTMFIAEVTDAKILSDRSPVTYADYHDHIKPKPGQTAENRKVTGWRCKICGYVYEGSELPEDYICPLCGHPAEDFEPVYES